MVHVDTIAMEPNSDASQAARYCLNVHDERASFRMAFPSHKRDAGSVVDAMHRFDDDDDDSNQALVDGCSSGIYISCRTNPCTEAAGTLHECALSASGQWSRRTIQQFDD